MTELPQIPGAFPTLKSFSKARNATSTPPLHGHLTQTQPFRAFWTVSIISWHFTLVLAT
jgi:hypothetical protein